ncbi:MAG: peptidylprolyl isomerase [Armatimonadetes bacterium]|nr:peptidylprolyl isomerase [Armatimonadota bacterium]MDW8027730.1 peptidylprolyl isomerase [Armatimonadota bacterium]
MPSLRRTRKKLQKQVVRWTIWFGITLIFILGMFSGFSWVERQVGIKLPREIASVNGTEISRQEYEQALMRVSQFGSHRLSPQDWSFYKEHIFNDMVDAELLLQESYRRRIRVTRADINKRIDEILQFQLASLKEQYERDKDFRDFVRTKYGSLDTMAKDLRSELGRQRSQIEREILMEKLRQSIESEVKVTEDELRNQYTKFKIRHIFVSFDKFMPKDKSASQQDRKKAQEQALQKAKELQERISKGEDFAKLAEKESDDTATKTKGGDLGELSADALRWRIGEDAPSILAKMKVGEISQPIEGFNGYHIVKLEGKKVELPNDYNKVRYRCEEKKCGNIWMGEKGEKKCPKCGSTKIKEIGERKKELIDQLRQQKVQERWSKLLQDLRNSAKVEIYDPELKAIMASREGKTDEAIRYYREALKIFNENPEARRHFIFPDVIHYQLSRLYMGQGKLKEAEREIRKALEYSDDNELHIQLGSILMLQGKKDEALKQFLKVANSSPTPSQRFILANYFEQLGRKELAEKQRKLAEKASSPTGLSIPLNVR